MEKCFECGAKEGLGKCPCGRMACPKHMGPAIGYEKDICDECAYRSYLGSPGA